MHKHNKRQAGIVSFMVTLIMMLVISLIVIGFSQTARRTSREALDSQLSSQAFYAAESGVNMAAEVARATNLSKDSCNNVAPYNTINPVLNAADDVSVTCILVDVDPDNIRVSANQNSSTVVPLVATGNMESLTFTWQPPMGTVNPTATGCTALGSFPEELNENCDFGLLRVELMRTPGTINFTNMTNNTRVFYLQPRNGTGSAQSVANFSGSRGQVLPANCSGNSCQATLVLGAAAGSSYYARISTIYRDSQQVTITGALGSAPVQFQGAQAVVDSTGKAKDVLRRVQVRVPLGITYAGAPYAVMSDDLICKRFTVGTGFFDNECLE